MGHGWGVRIEEDEEEKIEKNSVVDCGVGTGTGVRMRVVVGQILFWEIKSSGKRISTYLKIKSSNLLN